MFEKLAQEISEINSKNFHVTEFRHTGYDSFTEGSAHLLLPKSYRDFVSKFGAVKLYRVRDYYQLGVLKYPQEIKLQNGESVLCIGHFQSHKAYFKSSLISPDKDSPVFEEANNHLVKIAETFEGWFTKRSTEARKSYTKKEWQQILKGPKPFSPHEESVCLARKKYKWHFKEFDDDGNARIAVKNGSELVLPFLTIGVRTKDNSFGGRIWLNVAGILPGEEKIISHPCYKEQFARENIELYDLDDPIPEEREMYWEFK